jgi:hypothetical protein
MTLPITIRKRDGRLESFEPDKLSRSLFAATEALGTPNAFLARELADGVLHFLANESGQIAATEQLADLTVKVVRELGHPALARIYHEAHKRISVGTIAPQTVAHDDPALLSRDDVYVQVRKAAAQEIAKFSLEHAYPRDQVSAHREGLLELFDLETPFELSGIVLQGPYATAAWPMFEILRNARALAGSFVSLDGLDHQLASGTGDVETQVRGFVETFEKAIAVVGLRSILNLNIAEPPAWIGSACVGPLFGEFPNTIERERIGRTALLCLQSAKGSRVFWHLSDIDLADASSDNLCVAVEAALERSDVDFVFDRARHPVILGPGLNRGVSATLGQVGINLERFVAHLGGGPIDRNLWLRKLASLVRFAKSAGHARQDFLRERGDSRLREGFLLDRAVEVVVPIHLMRAARIVAGEAAEAEEVADLIRESLETMPLALETDRPRTTAAAIDWPNDAYDSSSAADVDMPIRKQLRQLAVWQNAAGGGGGAIYLKRNAPEIVKEVPDLLRAAWRLGVRRLRLV